MKNVKIYALNNGNNAVSFFKKAFDEGAAAVQCDIRRTLDGQFIAFRDRNLSRMCGRDWVVSGTSWSHIKNLPVRSGEPIPHLDDLLKFMVLHPGAVFFFRALLNTAQDVADLAHQISRAGVQTRGVITVSSSRLSFISAARKSVHDIGTAFCSSFPGGIVEKAKRTGTKRVCILPGRFPGGKTVLRMLSAMGSLADQVAEAAAEGIEISIGTVNGPNTLRRILDTGVKSLWTSDVELSSKLLKQR